MKFDNQPVRNVKALGSLVKESVKTQHTKIKIAKVQAQGAALKRMREGKRNTYQHSAGMATGVSKKVR